MMYLALINCPECSTVVSEHAMACVKCGYPIQKFMEDNMKENSIYESEQNQNINGGTSEMNEPFLGEDVDSTEGNNRVNGYANNPYHGKTKMVWGMIIFILGILTFFVYPYNIYASIFIGSFGFFLIIVGKAEHWWHWG